VFRRGKLIIIIGLVSFIGIRTAPVGHTYTEAAAASSTIMVAREREACGGARGGEVVMPPDDDKPTPIVLPIGYTPSTQQPARPTAHTARSQHCGHTALPLGLSLRVRVLRGSGVPGVGGGASGLNKRGQRGCDGVSVSEQMPHAQTSRVNASLLFRSS